MRPAFHFTSVSGWINDPLGLTFRDDRFHLFYQYVPEATRWAPQCRWGHATSVDLLTWDAEPIALEPGEGDGGCWSGSVVVDQSDRATMFYTSVDDKAFEIGNARIARPAAGSTASWENWDKGQIVAQLPEGESVVAFRDPFVFRDGARWRMVIGSGRTDGTAIAYGYVSDDLDTWTYDGIVASRHRSERDGLWTGSVWECPQLIEIGGRWVLLVSVWEPTRPHYTAYAIGDLDDGRFVQESPWQRLTFGPSYYAGAVFRDDTGAPGIIYWLRGVTDPEGEWAGAHSVPHQLTLRDGTLQIALPKSLLGLRGEAIPLENPARTPVSLGRAFDVEWTGGGQLSLDEEDRNVFRIERAGGFLTAVSDAGTWDVPCTGPVRLLVDGSVVELIGSFGSLAFPAPRAGDGMFSAEGSCGAAFALT